ncbi:Flp pilus assembly protein CpaB [Streptomonospora nanhaiensis]|uniref:Pilus assembly protein CpaB n=1 Tax=Streptomonospora nanhaiensis TaxID=1323731 RepID=A0A853BJA8_9ACTN|nr:Flp pilus assembly protein CpaB [Streptomonospora nanhaiensis]MBV2363230.1 Flp pilus assembly protein CpaB [Streptomonospora nanhaiensis]MBX9389665.1 Flp pilus assembly protein CpaB [Streptomonospora nanhaiensis]NYI95588.1 pilus assembly protein CpaB [Streptomonospora nanhaiensis]
MNPRQRRGVLLMIIATIGGVAVFLTVVSYVGTLNNELGSYRTALRLTQDVQPYEQITPDMLEEYEVPARFFDADTFIGDFSEISEEVGRLPVASSALQEGELLQRSMVIPAPDLEEGEREIAIMVDAETGVAGKVVRQSRVDVYAAFNPGEGQAQACAYRVLTNIEILDIGDIGSSIDETTGDTNSVVPVTFRLTPEQALNLTYAEAFATSLRLAAVSPQGSGDPGNLEFCTEDQLELIEEQADDAEAGGSVAPGATEPSAGAEESPAAEQPEGE